MISLKEGSKDYMGLGYLYNGMGYIQQKRENNEESIKFHYKAIDVRKKINYIPGLGASHHNIADCFINTGKLDSALFHAYKALKYRKIENSHKSIAEPYQSLGIIYCSPKKYYLILKLFTVVVKKRFIINQKY